MQGQETEVLEEEQEMQIGTLHERVEVLALQRIDQLPAEGLGIDDSALTTMGWSISASAAQATACGPEGASIARESGRSRLG